MKGGQMNEFLMVYPSGEVSRIGRIFSQSSLTLRSWKILWNQKYLLETLQVFNIECEDVNELVNVSMFIGLCSIFYIFDIEGMTKLILEMNFCMSVKWDE